MTTIQLELWQCLVIVGCCSSAVIVAFWALAQVIAKQAQEGIAKQFKSISEHLTRQDGRMTELEKTITDLRIELARDYVNRNDYVRDIGSLATKFEALAINVERMLRDVTKETLQMIKQEIKSK